MTHAVNFPVKTSRICRYSGFCLLSTLFGRQKYLLVALMMIGLLGPVSVSAAQDLGGNLLAGVEWDRRGMVKNDFYSVNFGSVIFDSDLDGQEELWVMGGEFAGTIDNRLRKSAGVGVGGGFPFQDMGNAPWSPRSDFRAIVFENEIWVFAGRQTSTSDVWHSADGVNWNQAPDAPWPTRGGYEVQVFQNRIWLMGGYDGQNFRNDVWSFDGTTWQQETAAPWTGRDGFSSVVFNGKIFVIGGRGHDGASEVVLSDIWTTSDGISWELATANMTPGPLREHASVVFDDRLWIIGGTISTDDNANDPVLRVGPTDEVWFSFDGINWSVASGYGETVFPRIFGHDVLVFWPAKRIDDSAKFQEFPRMCLVGGRQGNFWNTYVWADRRDHELISYSSPAADGPINVRSPKRNQAGRVTTSSITVTEDILVSDVNLNLTMDHSTWSDISSLRLILDYLDDDGSPQQRSHQMMYARMKDQGGLLDTVLTDEGAQLLRNIDLPFVDPDPQPRNYAIRPDDFLFKFDGVPATGTWTLEITDDASGNDGVLYTWSLDFRGMPIPKDPGITISPSEGLVTTEGGGSDSFDIVLASEPAAEVTIDLSSSNTGEGALDPTSLTFTPANWDTPQTVTVTGVDDTIEDGDVVYTIITAPATSTDPNYDGLNANDVSVTNRDDEVPAGGSQSYGSGIVNLSIPDNDPAGISSNILAGNHLITNLTVNVQINHERFADLEVFLIGPDNTQVQLFNFFGDNVVADFNGTSSLGLWTLEVYDTRFKKTGRLNSWSLTVDY